MTYPHNDLPEDTQIFAQLMVEQKVIQETAPAVPDLSRVSWKLSSGFRMRVLFVRFVEPNKADKSWSQRKPASIFTVAIMRHSLTRGIRLLGYTEPNKGEALLSSSSKVGA